ncbi:MAG: TIM barrel protein [Phycisphaerales bacterium]|nr:TIM barrel protein [Phycisphaerales bacterium]
MALSFAAMQGMPMAWRFTRTRSNARQSGRNWIAMNWRCLAWGTSLRLMEQSVVEQAAARLELAAQVEAKGIRVFCGPAPEGMEPAQVLETAAERLRDIAKTAQEFGVQVWLETHDTFMRGEQCAR